LTLEIAVDIGGTFTDLVGYDDEEGRIFGAGARRRPGTSRSA
jgi:N-methylhydantoinase A/oxoprolinase/acetone carboxylase beta subunit